MHKQKQKNGFFPNLIQCTLFENYWGAAMDPLAGHVFELPALDHGYLP